MTTISPSDLADDDPVPLKDAVRLFFPAGGITVSGLRRERDRGNLAVERISGKEFTTRRAIAEMRARCRVRKSRPDSNSGATGTESGAGSSETADAIAARDALNIKVRKLLERSPTTSGRAAGRTRSSVVPIRSASPTS